LIQWICVRNTPREANYLSKTNPEMPSIFQKSALGRLKSL
jgi:hypothetical protein